MIGKTMTFLVVAFFSNVAWAGECHSRRYAEEVYLRKRGLLDSN